MVNVLEAGGDVELAGDILLKQYGTIVLITFY